jgi:hypothetical protein
MVVLPPKTQNAYPCLKGSGPFASSICPEASPGDRCHLNKRDSLNIAVSHRLLCSKELYA